MAPKVPPPPPPPPRAPCSRAHPHRGPRGHRRRHDRCNRICALRCVTLPTLPIIQGCAQPSLQRLPRRVAWHGGRTSPPLPRSLGLRIAARRASFRSSARVDQAWMVLVWSGRYCWWCCWCGGVRRQRWTVMTSGLYGRYAIAAYPIDKLLHTFVNKDSLHHGIFVGLCPNTPGSKISDATPGGVHMAWDPPL